MRISVEDIMAHLEWRRKINKTPLSDFILIKEGKVVPIPKEVIDRWGLTGLNNIDFFSSGAYMEVK